MCKVQHCKVHLACISQEISSRNASPIWMEACVRLPYFYKRIVQVLMWWWSVSTWVIKKDFHNTPYIVSGASAEVCSPSNLPSIHCLIKPGGWTKQPWEEISGEVQMTRLHSVLLLDWNVFIKPCNLPCITCIRVHVHVCLYSWKIELNFPVEVSVVCMDNL